jgi:hypothetical protein
VTGLLIGSISLPQGGGAMRLVVIILDMWKS